MTTVNERRRLRREYVQRRQGLVQSYTQALLELGREYRRRREQLWQRRPAASRPASPAGPMTEAAPSGETQPSPPD